MKTTKWTIARFLKAIKVEYDEKNIIEQNEWVEFERWEEEETYKVVEVQYDRTGGYLDLYIRLFDKNGKQTKEYNGYADNYSVNDAIQTIVDDANLEVE